MATAQTNGHDKAYDFTPVDYDVSNVPPPMGPGVYEADITKVSSQGTKAGNFPMLVVEWTMKSVADGNEDNEQFVGQSVTDFIVIAEDQKYRQGKVRLRTMLDRLGLSFDLVPRRIENKGDFQELIDALTGQSLAVQVTVRERDGEQRASIEYRLPRDAQGGDDAGMEAAAERPAPAKKAAAKAPAKKTAARR
jgi:hypothetical protein